MPHPVWLCVPGVSATSCSLMAYIEKNGKHGSRSFMTPTDPNSQAQVPPNFVSGQDTQKALAETEDKGKLVHLIHSKISEGQQDKQKYGYPGKMEKYNNLYKNQLYQNQSQDQLYFESKANYYRVYVDKLANILTRDPVQDAIVRKDKKPIDLKVEVLSRILEYIHKVNNRFEREFDLGVTAGKFGNGFMYTYYDPNKDEMRGLPCYHLIDPKYILVSPGATSLEDAVWVAYKRPVSTYQLQLAYPDMEQKIKPDSDVSTTITDNQKDGKFVFTNTDPSLGGLSQWTMTGNKIGAGYAASNQTWLIDFYYKDPRKVELQNEMELRQWIDGNPGFGNQSARDALYMRLTGEKFPLSVLRYPHGRKIQMASDQILEDFANPYPWIPFLEFGVFSNPGELWKQGIIELIRQMVANIHLASSGLAANVDFRCRPFWVTDDPGWDDKEAFTTNPNDVKKLSRQGTFLKPADIPQVAPKDVLELIIFRMNEIDTVTGLRDVLFGVNPANSTSGVQLDKLQDAALGVLVPIFRRFNAFRTQLGNRLLWMVQNYMTDARQISFVSQEEIPYISQTMDINTEQPSLVGNNGLLNDVTQGQWEYIVEETSGMPFSKAAKAQQINAAAEVVAKFRPDMAAILQLEALQLPSRQQYEQAIVQAFEGQQKAAAQQAQQEAQVTAADIQSKIKERSDKADAAMVTAGATAQLSQASATEKLAKAQNLLDGEKEKDGESIPD